MDHYSFLRELADSWVLLLMCLFFIGSVIWAYRPGSRRLHREISEIPFRNDDAPACENNCANCVCKKLTTDLEVMS